MTDDNSWNCPVCGSKWFTTDPDFNVTAAAKKPCAYCRAVDGGILSDEEMDDDGFHLFEVRAYDRDHAEKMVRHKYPTISIAFSEAAERTNVYTVEADLTAPVVVA